MYRYFVDEAVPLKRMIWGAPAKRIRQWMCYIYIDLPDCGPIVDEEYHFSSRSDAADWGFGRVAELEAEYELRSQGLHEIADMVGT